MQSDGWGRRNGRSQELNELDRLLSRLTRPLPLGASLPGDVRLELRGLGVLLAGSARREELIERVWCRKRPLLRQLGDMDDPLPPSA